VTEVPVGGDQPDAARDRGEVRSGADVPAAAQPAAERSTGDPVIEDGKVGQAGGRDLSLTDRSGLPPVAPR